MSINVQSADDEPDSEAVTREFTAVGAAPGSIIDKLRKQAKSQQKKKIKAFSVGGDFGDWLQIRYTPLPADQLDDFIANQTEVSQERAVELNMDMMARSCVDVIGVDQDTMDVTILEDDRGPVRLEHRLIVLLEMPIPDGAMLTAREVISYIFGNNGLAIGSHGDEIVTWMRKPGATEGNS
jgi:hypothetical protein